MVRLAHLALLVALLVAATALAATPSAARSRSKVHDLVRDALEHGDAARLPPVDAGQGGQAHGAQAVDPAVRGGQEGGRPLRSRPGRKYGETDRVPLYVNKVGPYANPSESYDFYSLPFCKPEASDLKIRHRHVSLGEALEGDHIANSLYDIRFRVPVYWSSVCQLHLHKKEINQFINAIDQYYVFEMLLDDVPVRGFVGTASSVGNGGDGDAGSRGVGDAVAVEKPTDKYYLFKHLHFTVQYNGDAVIHATVTADLQQVQELTADLDDLLVEFSYSVEWEESSVPWEKRQDLLHDKTPRTEIEIRWLSIMNSMVLVLVLTGFIALIVMRILKRDYARYAASADLDDGGADDYGWKLVHGEVFRFPKYKMMFSALIGNGAQFVLLTLCMLVLEVIGIFYPEHGRTSGEVLSAALFMYALTCGVAGFVACRLYRQMGGERWAWCVVATASLFAVPASAIGMFTNGVALQWHANAALHLSTLATMLGVWCIIGFPLTLVGGVMGRRTTGDFEQPTRTKKFPREIPTVPWYRHSAMQVVLAGFLPFSAVYIELYYIYSSLWGHHYYSLYGILFLVYLVLLAVTACITVAMTYFQLSYEDWRWWSASLMNGGATAVYVWFYSIFFYEYRSNMHGFLQSTFYYGYMTIACIYFWMLLASVGWWASLIFVRKIYAGLKLD